MPITPDTKDWTWVLDKTCPECGFAVTSFDVARIGSMVRTNASRWPELLAHPEVRTRPTDDRWSGLEYACHVRDVFVLYDERLRMMLEEDDPDYPNWDQNAASVEGGYAGQDPARVAAEIEAAGTRLADRFESVEGDQWERTGNRSDGVRFTVETFARYFIHDPIHHVHDVTKGYERLTAS